jgi:phage tail-like protein
LSEVPSTAEETIALASPNGDRALLEHPPAASGRSYLRSGLPSIYHSPGLGSQDGQFGIGFVAALEEVLDPVVAVLDCLAAYLDPDLAPLQMVDALAAWLGMEPDEQLPEERRRELVRRGTELARRSGTRAGLELALHVVFPDVPLRVEDGGGVAVATAVGDLPDPGAGGFVVYCDTPLPVERQAAIARVIDRYRPANVGYRLRVKAPRRAPEEKA